MSTLYNSDRAYSNSWLVYINGLQVPAQGASVTFGVWQMPQASITMVPDPILHRLGAEDRVQVQVFYCDQWQHDPPQFCIQFDGEITAWGYVSAGNQRAISLQCIDYAAILTQLFFFFMSSFDDMAVGASNQAIGVMGSTIQLAGFGAVYPYSLFSQGLADPGDGGGNNAVIKRPIDFAYNIVRALIKAQHPDRAVPAANFFAPWVKRTNFHRRWVALPYFDEDPDGNNSVGVFPILRAVQSESALAATARMASTTGGAGSLWDMISELLRTMLMEISMLPTPAAVSSDFRTLLPRGEPDVSYGQIFLTSYFVKPQCFFGIPPVCNVFFPSQISSYTYQENYATQPTRLYFNEERLLSYLNQNGNGSSALSAAGNSLAQDAMCTGFPEEVDIAARDAVSQAGQNGKNLLVYPEEFFKGPVIDRRAMPRWFAFLLDSMRIVGDDTSQQGDDADGSDESRTPGTTDGALNTGSPNASPQESSTSHVLTPEETAELGGAEGVIKDVSAERFTQVFHLDIQGYEGALTEAQYQSLRRFRQGPIGSFTPPQRSPFEPAVVPGKIERRGPGARGSFWATRGGENGKPARVHAGHDISWQGCFGKAVVSTTPGTVIDVTYEPEGSGDRGRSVTIEDDSGKAHSPNGAGAKHRYLHLSEIASINGRRIERGMRVEIGTRLGSIGRTGHDETTYGAHLHYDVTSSGRYKLDFTNRLNAFLAGRAAPAISQTTPAHTGAQPAAPVTNAAQARPTSDQAAAEAPAPAPANTQLSATDTTRNLYKLYAAYEYYKERYSQRTGAVQMAFNPYPIPGFPCATFDRRSTALDTFAYVMSVRQSFSPGGMSTEVAFSHGRTIQEMFALMQRTSALEALSSGQNYQTISQAVMDLPASPVTEGATGNENAASQANPPTQAQAGTGQAPEGPAATGTPDERLAGIALPVGAIGTAPAEPLEEIRKVIQNFQRAEEFYKGVFFQGRSFGMDVLNSEVYQRSRQTEGATLATNLNEVQVSADIAANRPIDDTIRAAQDRIVDQENQAPQTSPDTPKVGVPKSAVFYYPDVIEMVTPNGAQIPISIEGLDSGTRTALIRAARAIRSGTSTPEDRQLLTNATGQTNWPMPPAPQNSSTTLTNASTPDIPPPPFTLDPATDEYLKRLEIDLRVRAAQTNVRGDVQIVPKKSAEPLFESYTAAMLYNARPICTLEEYIDFLGPDGLREQLVGIGNSELYGNRQVHPAPFYVRIRRFRQGPPQERPRGNMTNSLSLSDAPAGISATVPVSSAVAFANLGSFLGGDSPQVKDLIMARLLQATNAPRDLPELVQRFLTTSTPGGANIDVPAAAQGILTVVAGEATVANMSTLYPQLAASRLFTPEELSHIQQELDRSAGRLAGLVPDPTDPGAAPENVPRTGTATGNAPAANGADAPATGAFGSQTVTIDNRQYTEYPVDGIPLDFAETRADWDSLLEQYRYNVLTRLAPLP